jgi:ATP-dependent DNA helicase RecQ
LHLDWGHDFQPDYQRIVRIVKLLPKSVPVVGVTATANDRVARRRLHNSKRSAHYPGPVDARRSALAQHRACRSSRAPEAWLAENLPKFPGSGIIYSLTVADSNRVARWLQQQGLDARPYNADMTNEERISCEEALLNNQVKVLSATVALGMGFDKPDLSFVIHFQRPGNVVAYYQQVGRAGRALKASVGILLAGREDDEIQNYFIESAFPPPEVMEGVLKDLANSNGLAIADLQKRINGSYATLEKALKLLAVEGAVAKEKTIYHRTLNPWHADYSRYEAVTQVRRQELEKMREYVRSKECLMAFLARELSDPFAHDCGRCSNCSTPSLPGKVINPQVTLNAIKFLQRDYQTILPRKQWPGAVQLSEKRAIPEEWQNCEGRALCIYGDAGWGRLVAQGTYRDHHFSDELAAAAAQLIMHEWRPDPFPRFVTAVPSLRAANLVKDFSLRLASIEIPFVPILAKTKETRPQKEMAQQRATSDEHRFGF